ncbi:hypothetical protein C3L33_06155, partial [Rhododendron williamsianum]
MSRHGRVYKDEQEEGARFKIFKDNVDRINAFNSGADKGYKLGVNQFADLTNEEFRASRNGYKRQSPSQVISGSEPFHGTCKSKKLHKPVAAKITGYEDVPKNSEKALLQAVANQPVSVAIDAGGDYSQFYSSGVFNGLCGTMLDHGVTTVGYGTTSDGTKYSLIKNSWGSGWGDNGYKKMKRDVAAKEGLCGIA